MNKRQTIDAFFLWGTALARLASQNEDATLAEAAADKFQEMHELSGGDDAAMGAVGYSLWASSLLIMALEQQSREVLDKALEKFQQAVDVDGGTTFETRFQYARALKEGGDMVKFLEEEAAAMAAATSVEVTSVTKTAEKKEYRQYYERALTLCEELERVYEEEVSRAHAAKERDQADGGDDDEEEQEDEGDEEEEEEGEEDNDDDDAFDDDDVDPDDDIVNVTDLAEVKLLQAILHGMLEDDASDEQARANVDRTIALFKRAMELDVENPGVLMELANYVALKCTTRRQNRILDSVAWDEIMDFLDDQYRLALARVEFDMAECKQICFRKDTEQEEEPEDEESTDAQVPHLLHALGKALVSYLIGEACANGAAQSAKLPKKATLAELKKMGKIQGSGGVRGSGGGKGFLSKMKGKGKLSMLNSKTGKKHPRFLHTIEVLRSAHHFHDKLGCYPLACLFAHSAYQDEAQCKVWLETAETYGVLDDELQLHDFEAFWEAPWFAKFTQPVEQIEVDDEAQEDDAAKEADSAVAH